VLQRNKIEEADGNKQGRNARVLEREENKEMGTGMRERRKEREREG
jgi:hypothetical protein